MTNNIFDTMMLAVTGVELAIVGEHETEWSFDRTGLQSSFGLVGKLHIC